MAEYDVCVIGGGIHGCAAAAEAANRGLKVILLEKNDLASQTSSASSKLIHGGLRYLEQGEFSLVKEALQARQTLLTHAPHLVHPLRFVMPLEHSKRSKWQIRLGLMIYDFLARKDALPRSSLIQSKNAPTLFSPLQDTTQEAFSYYDAYTDDARLTIENALLAKQLGASLQTRTLFTSAKLEENRWRIHTHSKKHGEKIFIAKSIINTAGPWVNEVLSALPAHRFPEIAWVKGSHLVLPKRYEGEHAYLLQHPDSRVVFCLPYYGCTVIGTTDRLEQNLTPPITTEEEKSYLFDLLGFFFKPQAKKALADWSGIRTLVKQKGKAASQLSRHTTCFRSDLPAPIVTLYGGKLTTHQSTAFRLVQAICENPITPKPLYFPGAPEPEHFALQVKQLQSHFQWLPSELFKRYLAQYGLRTQALLGSAKAIEDLGFHFGQGLYEREIQFLCDFEWAQTSEDILWRRTKLGLKMSQSEQETLKKRLP